MLFIQFKFIIFGIATECFYRKLISYHQTNSEFGILNYTIFKTIG